MCQYSTYQKYSHWHSSTKRQTYWTVCLQKDSASYIVPIQWTTAIDSFVVFFLFFFSVKIYNTKPTFLYSPKMSPKVRKYSLESREVSFGRLLTVWFPTYSVRSRTRSHLLCSDTQRTQVTFMFPLTPTALQKPQMLPVSFITAVSSRQDEQ